MLQPCVQSNRRQCHKTKQEKNLTRQSISHDTRSHSSPSKAFISWQCAAIKADRKLRFHKKHTYFKKSTKQWSQTQNRKQRNQTPPNFIFFLPTLFSALHLHFVSLKHFSNIYFYLKDLRIKYSLCVLTRVRFICRFDSLAGKQKKILNTFLWNSDGRWIWGQNRTC